MQYKIKRSSKIKTREGKSSGGGQQNLNGKQFIGCNFMSKQKQPVKKCMNKCFMLYVSGTFWKHFLTS